RPIDRREIGECVESDDATLEVVRFEDCAELGEAHQATAELHTAFDDRAPVFLDQAKDLVTCQESGKVLTRCMLRKILDLLCRGADAAVEILLESVARRVVEGGLRPGVMHPGRNILRQPHGGPPVWWCRTLRNRRPG